MEKSIIHKLLVCRRYVRMSLTAILIYFWIKIIPACQMLLKDSQVRKWGNTFAVLRTNSGLFTLEIYRCQKYSFVFQKFSHDLRKKFNVQQIIQGAKNSDSESGESIKVPWCTVIATELYQFRLCAQPAQCHLWVQNILLNRRTDVSNCSHMIIYL